MSAAILLDSLVAFLFSLEKKGGYCSGLRSSYLSVIIENLILPSLCRKNEQLFLLYQYIQAFLEISSQGFQGYI